MTRARKGRRAAAEAEEGGGGGEGEGEGEAEKVLRTEPQPRGEENITKDKEQLRSKLPLLCFGLRSLFLHPKPYGKAETTRSWPPTPPHRLYGADESRKSGLPSQRKDTERERDRDREKHSRRIRLRYITVWPSGIHDVDSKA